MKPPELKPCPFCGGKARLFTDDDKYYSHIVACENCGARTLREHIEAIAVSYWNRRVTDAES